MSAAGRRRGSSFEIELRDGFRSEGMDVERLRLTGMKDEGDLVIRDMGHLYVVEAKAEARINLPGYIAESELEATHYAAARGLSADSVTPIVIVKRRGKGWRHAYVVQSVQTFFDLWGECKDASTRPVRRRRLGGRLQEARHCRGWRGEDEGGAGLPCRR